MICFVWLGVMEVVTLDRVEWRTDPGIRNKNDRIRSLYDEMPTDSIKGDVPGSTCQQWRFGFERKSLSTKLFFYC